MSTFPILRLDPDKTLCTQVDDAIFYPGKGESADAAKAVCRSCEARVECLAYSIEIADREGVFGGFTARARQRIERRHRAGESLEDIIAEDDAAHYAQVDRAAERARVAAATQKARQRARRAAALAELEVAS